MDAALLLQTLAAPLGAALLSWRWPRLGYLWGALALWLVGCLLGGAYGLPVKAWQWLPLTLLPGILSTIAPLWPAYHLGQLALKVVGFDMGQPIAMHVAVLIGIAALFFVLAQRRLSAAE